MPQAVVALLSFNRVPLPPSSAFHSISGSTMSIKEAFVFVMNPYARLNLQTETSLLLMQELLERGHGVYWLQEDELSLQHNRLTGRVHAVESVTPFRLGPPYLRDLDEFDALLLRKDPPFDTRYLQLTLLLDFLDPRVVQFNETRALRNFNEKLLPLLWPHFTPPTLVSRSASLIAQFVDEHRHVILKPLHDCSGRGISKVDWDENGSFHDAIARALSALEGDRPFVLAQKFLPNVSNGDKRVFLVDGKPIGAVNRLPRPGTFLANIHQGALCEKTSISDKELQIIDTIAPVLRREGIFLAGADFIDGFLTEVNITSPSAVRQINAVSGERLEGRIVDLMLECVRRKRAERTPKTNWTDHSATAVAIVATGIATAQTGI